MYFIIIAIVVVVDQAAKFLIRTNMQLDTTIPIIDGIFHITYIHNYGAAFSIFQNRSEILILLPAVVITAAMIFLFKKRKKEHWCMLLSISLIVAGGIGNLIDRIFKGYVVDFFDFRIWPIFNIADMAVCTGCGLLIIYMFFIEPKMPKKETTIYKQ